MTGDNMLDVNFKESLKNVIQLVTTFFNNNHNILLYPINTNRPGYCDYSYDEYVRRFNGYCIDSYVLCPESLYAEYVNVCNQYFLLIDTYRIPSTHDRDKSFGLYYYDHKTAYDIIKECSKYGNPIFIFSPATVSDLTTERLKFNEDYEASFKYLISMCNEWIDYWNDNLKNNKINNIKILGNRTSTIFLDYNVVLDNASHELTTFITKVLSCQMLNRDYENIHTMRESFIKNDGRSFIYLDDYVDSISHQSSMTKFRRISHKYHKMLHFLNLYFEDVTGRASMLKPIRPSNMSKIKSDELIITDIKY